MTDVNRGGEGGGDNDLEHKGDDDLEGVGDGGGEGFSNRPGWLGITSWEVWLCLPAHGSPSLAVALLICGGVESGLQKELRE